MKNILISFLRVSLLPYFSICAAYGTEDNWASPRYNETCDSLENAELCENNCNDLYQTCLEKCNDQGLMKTCATQQNRFFYGIFEIL